jgi:hypothetical protein
MRAAARPAREHLCELLVQPRRRGDDQRLRVAIDAD